MLSRSWGRNVSRMYRDEANSDFHCNIRCRALGSAASNEGLTDQPETIEMRRATSVTRIADLAMVQ